MLTQTERLGRSYHLHLPGANRSVAIVVILLAFLTGVTLEVAYERGVVEVDWNSTGLELVWRQCLELSPNATVMSARDWQRIVHDLLGQVLAIWQACAPRRRLICLFRIVWGRAMRTPKHTDMIAKHVVQKILNILFCVP